MPRRSASAKRKATDVGEVLLLGCEGAGKTLLCRHLDKLAKGDTNFPVLKETQPSIGIEMVTIGHRSKSFTLREVGGSMQPVWHKYFDGCAAVILVADTATGFGASNAAVELAELIRSDALQQKRLLLLLNKQDLEHAIPEESLQLLLRLPMMQACAGTERLKVLPASALTGDGLTQVMDWCVSSCVEHANNPAVAQSQNLDPNSADGQPMHRSRWRLRRRS